MAPSVLARRRSGRGAVEMNIQKSERQQKKERKRQERERLREKLGIGKRKRKGRFEHNGFDWVMSYHTGRWFLFGVGFVEKQDGQWLGGVMHRKIKPRRKLFPRRGDAMTWVEEKGGKPRW